MAFASQQTTKAGHELAAAARVHPEETFHRLTVLMSVSMPSGMLNVL